MKKRKENNSMWKNESFSAYDFKTGTLADFSQSEYPTKVHAINGDDHFILNDHGTTFMFVLKGYAYYNSYFPFKTGMYASLVGGYISGSKDSKILLVERMDYKGVFLVGGPIEAKGRLKYIDGCTDSLLIPPVMCGDACFNHLHFPPRINQTMHTHPSIRVGVVARGQGECVTPFGNVPLTRGMVFVIHEENGHSARGLDGKMYPIGSHCFRTFDETMDVIAFHPDSDFGPKDEEHPMINRTIVDGVSAKELEHIRTK